VTSVAPDYGVLDSPVGGGWRRLDRLKAELRTSGVHIRGWGRHGGLRLLPLRAAIPIIRGAHRPSHATLVTEPASGSRGVGQRVHVNQRWPLVAWLAKAPKGRVRVATGASPSRRRPPIIPGAPQGEGNLRKPTETLIHPNSTQREPLALWEFERVNQPPRGREPLGRNPVVSAASRCQRDAGATRGKATAPVPTTPEPFGKKARERGLLYTVTHPGVSFSMVEE